MGRKELFGRRESFIYTRFTNIYRHTEVTVPLTISFTNIFHAIIHLNDGGKKCWGVIMADEERQSKVVLFFRYVQCQMEVFSQ